LSEKAESVTEAGLPLPGTTAVNNDHFQFCRRYQEYDDLDQISSEIYCHCRGCGFFDYLTVHTDLAMRAKTSKAVPKLPMQPKAFKCSQSFQMQPKLSNAAKAV
jgi:hypothetical protein